MPDFKTEIYHLLEDSENNNTISKRFNIFISILIIVNIASVVLESVNSIDTKYNLIFITIEFISTVVFTIEYLLRIWSADVNPKYKNKRLSFIFTPTMILDLLAILPFYVPAKILKDFDLRLFRIFRLLRMLRIFKLSRYNKSISLLTRVINREKEPLLLTALLAILTVVFSSAFVYAVEHDVQPEKFASIPDAMWWGIATLTTVGYGDVYPITVGGRVFTFIILLIGLGIVAIPTGIISSSLTKVVEPHSEEE